MREDERERERERERDNDRVYSIIIHNMYYTNTACQHPNQMKVVNEKLVSID